MRKVSILLSLLVVFVLVLSACAPSEEAGEPTPGFDQTPGAFETPEVPPLTTPALTPEITVELTPEMTPETTVELTPEETLEGTPEGTPEGEAFLNTNPTMASDLIGLGVRNAEGENLGEIEELVVDSANGDIHYAVIGAGGFLGLGEKLILVPFAALNIDPLVQEVDQLVHLNIDQQVLTDAPNFDDLPDLTAADWDADIRSYWQDKVEVLPVTGPEGQPVRAIRISDPTDINIQNVNGEDIGDIENMILDLDAGRISYIILATGGVLDLGECLLPVPWGALQTSAEEEGLLAGTTSATPIVEETPTVGEEAVVDESEVVFMLDTTANDLTTAPCFASMDEFPETRVPDWDAEILNFWMDVTS
jgi:sporulation protein YlmC with PRC-barrel domain